MKAAQLIYGAIWAASAVEVSNYTWKALTDQYSKFPDPSGGGGGSTPPVSLLPGVLPANVSPPSLGQIVQHPGKSLGAIAGMGAQPITPPQSVTTSVAKKVWDWLGGIF